MDDVNGFGLAAASESERRQVAEGIVDLAWSRMRPRVVDGLLAFLARPTTAAAVMALEVALLGLLRELGRALLSAALNALEPEDPTLLPRELLIRGDYYRRVAKKTRLATVASLFGAFEIWRRGYRHVDGVERMAFPLEILLGLVHGATPACADRIGRLLGEAGAWQARALEVMRCEHDVRMGAPRLRKIAAALADSLGEFELASLADGVAEALRIADSSAGGKRPVLAVGRDGATMRGLHRCFGVATAATLTVIDRSGLRLFTAYLAFSPELGQGRMTARLTKLIQLGLAKWRGATPTLAYIADCGDHEEGGGFGGAVQRDASIR